MPRGSSKIRTARKKLGQSQLQLALNAGVGVRTLQLAEGGKDEVSDKTLKRIADALGLCLEDVCYHDEALSEDDFDKLPWSMSRFIRKRVAPSHEAFCRDEADTQAVLGLMRESWSVHLGNTTPEENEDIFFEADEQLNKHYFRYEKRYLDIWNKNPATLMLATHGDERRGASVVLPVTDDAYERFYNGEVSFMDLTEEDVLYESQNLVLDHAVEFCGTGNPAWYRFTESLSYSVFCQIAMLSIDPTADDFRMISFGASPLNIKRLFSIGFQDSGSTMPEFQYPICHFSVDQNEQSDGTYVQSTTTTHYAHLFKRFCKAPSRISAKRRILTHVLRAMQPAVKPMRHVATNSSDSHVA
ncbi:transcriptional regulator with XRE-family HTH domain [Rhodopirellula rubra]|uniref:Transcriptional regulator with XRE-family HTH domain n=1 Tax=Aporhodopirellula rubra TaxID=980271 RepID=A0A7W5DXQ0_9BACT|nr:helix-turn-helix domain-containing protein [Aporhodopirellula rubra]MBB3206460.1 transcriptional regulator with XRE-family HTH domain [Aporhodopirellula rubra]